jgi:hypothetical protein
MLREYLGPSFDKFFFLPVDGTHGGILLAWQSALVLVSNPHFSMNAVTTRVSMGVDQSWWFTGVYGPQRDVDKCALLQKMQDIRDLHVGLWFMAGDFNVIVDPTHKSHGSMRALWHDGQVSDGSINSGAQGDISQRAAVHLVQ